MAVTAPTLPASGTPVTNPTGQFVSVALTLNGATGVTVTVNGVQVGTGAGNYQLPPGGTITVVYTGGPPTWAWTNPLDVGYTPGYYAPNTQAEAAGWNPYTALPYAQHIVAGIPGLGTGVSN